ncbi:MAG: hypothetical protein RSG48_02950 [Clostridia bacterium]
MKNKLVNKLKEIDVLLNSQEKLDKYIVLLEKSSSDELDIPLNLGKKIHSKINKEINCNKNIQKENIIKINKGKDKKTKYLDILKIAACTAFALIMWETILSKPVTYGVEDINIKKEDFYEITERVMNNVSDACLKPFHIERRNEK